MPKFTKKPVEVEARQFDGTQGSAKAVCAWMAAYGCEALRAFCGHDEPYQVYISTLEGRMTASAGDWIIRGVKGEFYPCKPDIFAETYETSTLSHAAGQEVVATGWTKADGKTLWLEHDGFPLFKPGKHDDINTNRAVHLCLAPAVTSNTTPPTTSAEVGQEGEQCRAASGEVEALERNLVDAMNQIHRLDQARQRWIDRAVKMRRAYREQQDLLLALSRGVPEGNQAAVDSVIRQYCRTCGGCGEIGGHSGQTPESYEEWSAPCPDCSPAAIAAQRKEG